jgi:hypothetical protein
MAVLPASPQSVERGCQLQWRRVGSQIFGSCARGQLTYSPKHDWKGGHEKDGQGDQMYLQQSHFSCHKHDLVLLHQYWHFYSFQRCFRHGFTYTVCYITFFTTDNSMVFYLRQFHRIVQVFCGEQCVFRPAEGILCPL